jgi:cytidyltransferase-like protein
MKRVYADVVGDLFHVGHINMFRQARSHGDYLIVGVHSDKTVESYKRKPIISEQDRYEIIKNCKLVDEVIIDAPLVITKDYIKENKIDIVIHGDDTNILFNEQHKIPLEMGIMKYVKYTKGISTSEVIKRIKK